MYHIVDLIQKYESNTEIAAMAGVDANDDEVAYVFGKITRSIIKDVNFIETIDRNDEWKGMIDELYLYNEVIALASKLVNNSSEVSRYVTLPDLKKLDVSYNALLTGFERITELKGLRELYANSNYITDLSEVNWEEMKYLRALGLGYNYISDIQALENLPFLQYLDVSHNLISGPLKFNLTKVQDTLKEFDLSYNQITDITCIMQFLDMWSGGNDANWLAREDTLNLNLNNQNIVINLEEPIYLDLNPQTVDIELPKIFTQLAAIDVNRTAFGETS
jgi:Leucine-rich repeat (LRR) protein